MYVPSLKAPESSGSGAGAWVMGRSIIQKPSEGPRSAHPQAPGRVMNLAQVALTSSAHPMPLGGQFPDTAVTSHLERRASVPEVSSAITGAQRVQGQVLRAAIPGVATLVGGGGCPSVGHF